MAGHLTRAAAFVALLVTTVCASQGGCGAKTDAVKVPSTLVCGTYEAIQPDGTSQTRPQYYIVSAMNRKLEYFPEFATTIGMASVANCNDADKFAAAYAAYFKTHPYFDKDLPNEPSAAKLAPSMVTALAQPGTSVIPKIFNGQTTGPSASSTDLFPVVELSYQVAGGTTDVSGHTICPLDSTCTERCTGTFIARNWILTAAHCIAPLAIQSSVLLDPQWITDEWWQIDWPDPSGNVAPVGGAHTLVTRAASIVHPDYIGLTSVQANNPTLWNSPVAAPMLGQGYDIALLWIYPTAEDGNLAANPQNSSWYVQLQDVSGIINGWELTDYGYGPTVNNASSDTPPVLTSATLEIAPNTPAGPGGASSALDEPVMNLGTTFGSLCEGDSGGPLVRTVTTSSGNQTVIVGVNSGFYPSTPADSGITCSFQMGQTTQWARADVATSFITETIQSWWDGSTFSPTVLPDGSNPNSFVQFWGSSCSTDCDCSVSEYCSNPVSDPNGMWGNGLLACAGGCSGGSCSCYVGQCLPLAEVPEAGSDGGNSCMQQNL
jgi:hypothetical protein